MSRATKKDLSWFDLNNYNFINKLTLSEFIQELEWREFLYRNVNEDSLIFDDEYEVKYQRIFSGDPNLDVPNEEEKEISEFIKSVNAQGPSLRTMYGELPKLSSSLGVSPITFTELSMYGYSAIDQGFFKRDEEYFYIKPEAMLASVTGNLKKCFTDMVLLSVNLDDATDEEILVSMRKLLPLWRKQLELPEHAHVAPKKIGVKTLQKLITNRVLPILDLIIWEKRFDKMVTNPMIGVLVFNDDPKDTQSIKETIKPFALEVMTEEYTRLLRLYMNRDGEISSAKMSELMSRIL
ncbi:hypothetical protein LZX53_002227 [Salmonella enterica]|uniref:Uncharacterized protein n=3 Tax=Salmonella enterica TaxID=28901 RepID=A0A5U8XWK9_SALET|nr:DUF6387 family protein [Salmonella enterica]EAA6710298.1 hypothetical protein [Salmonella enterica subsp. enterica serovar Arechavaleta]EAB6566769.1 hypothetical protein [Salmonella enterica subsp. enterica serovar Sandiego]EBH8100857.1 hypothetical protein [Salmonella enterica subsp. houtenae serovar O:11:g,z25:-]ECI3748692.1 hypothetical protein [Salmonella enterica subsp. enterica serovar Mountpleasant]EDB4404181.1 hypothetical protein [Salmonella enterica subsp. enterica serovar Schwarz